MGVFSDRLPHGFSLVNQQVAAGLFSTKRLHKCLEEITSAPHGMAETEAALKTRDEKLDTYRKQFVDDMQPQYKVVCLFYACFTFFYFFSCFFFVSLSV